MATIFRIIVGSPRQTVAELALEHGKLIIGGLAVQTLPITAKYSAGVVTGQRFEVRDGKSSSFRDLFDSDHKHLGQESE